MEPARRTTDRPEIALIVSTFERPQHLRRTLNSIALQEGVTGAIELVVTDDGSHDETHEVVSDFATCVDFPVKLTTHDHDGFRLARCRNEGAAASIAPYLLFLDGDCVLPPDHVAIHRDHRQMGRVVAGDCYRLSETASKRIDAESVRRGDYRLLSTRMERKRLSRKSLRALCYQLLNVPMRPRLTGNNIGIWREDFERVNGFDENYVGWGYEDRDLQRRLHKIGVRAKTILPWTATYHMWHPPDPTFSRNGIGTANRDYYMRSFAPEYCLQGLIQRCARGVNARLCDNQGAQWGRFVAKGKAAPVGVLSAH